MAEQNPSTQPEEKAVEAPQTESHHHAAEGAHAHTGSEKKQAIKEALKPQARRTSVVEDYSAELDEMASLTRALQGQEGRRNLSGMEEGLPLRHQTQP